MLQRFLNVDLWLLLPRLSSQYKSLAKGSNVGSDEHYQLKAETTKKTTYILKERVKIIKRSDQGDIAIALSVGKNSNGK